MNMTAQTLDTLIAATKGRIVTVDFIKNNGESRVITGRIGVKHSGTPASHRQDSRECAFFLIYSMRDRGYRRIAVDRVISVKMDGLYLFNSTLLQKTHTVAS